MQWFRFSPLPELDWLQIEISTLCTAACSYCPRTLFSKHWRNQYMKESQFRRLLPVLRRSRLAYLQGWGEPLTHPDFFGLVRLAKNAGCQVGTTTNGTLLDEHGCERMVREGVDILCFSLTGLGADNDSNRRGTHFDQVLETIATLTQIKKQSGSQRPQIHIAYLLLRSGLDELDHLPQLLGQRGISQVVISLLQPFGAPGLTDDSYVPRSEQEHLNLRRRLESLTAQGRNVGLDIHWRLPALPIRGTAGHPQKPPLPFCSENIQKAAFIGVNGDVSPCVFCNLPVEPAGQNELQQAGYALNSFVFGNISTTDFKEIWHSPAYKAFRNAHLTGQFPSMCQHCINLVT